MKALVFDGAPSLNYRDTAEPQPATGEVLVRVRRVGICGTDLGAVGKNRPPLRPGLVPGHEFAGIRADTGEAVAVNPLVSCGHCAACLRGQDHICAERVVIGVHRDGAFAPLVAVPERNLFPIGDMAPERGALIEPLATGLHALRLLPERPARLAIIGAGSIGLATLAAAVADGIAFISVSDLAEDRLDHARRLGAHVTVAEHEGIFDAVIDAVGAEQTRNLALALLRPGGTAVFVGLAAPQIVLAGAALVATEKTVKGAFGFTRAEYAEAAQIAATIGIDWVATYSLDAGAEVFAALLRGEAQPGEVKVQLSVDGN